MHLTDVTKGAKDNRLVMGPKNIMYKKYFHEIDVPQNGN
jgi:hypothetical protein